MMPDFPDIHSSIGILNFPTDRNSELHVIPECGHFVHIEKPDAYFSLITAFLRG